MRMWQNLSPKSQCIKLLYFLTVSAALVSGGDGAGDDTGFLAYATRVSEQNRVVRQF